MLAYLGHRPTVMDIMVGGRPLSFEELRNLGDLGVKRIRDEIHNITTMMEEEITLEAPVTGEMIALLTILSLFTIVGSVGNGLVLFVFSRVRDKTTAQLFILALAMIDLFTCMVIIPLTMFVEYTRYDIKYDWLCKLYQFLITSKVPLSAFIMVAIAFDRYFCICHPLRKIITPWRTKVTIASLTLFAAMLGVMTSLAYGVNQVFYPYDPDIYHNILNSSFTPEPPETIKDWTKLGEDPSTKNDVTMTVELRLKDWLLRRNFTSLEARKGIQETVYIGICAPNEILLSWDFVSVYQKCYTVLFLICLVIVGVLYGMIYRFIGMRRNKKLQQRLVLCAYVNSTHGCREGGTRITMIHSNVHDTQLDDDKYDCNSQGLGPGGIYIGGCTTTASTTPPQSHGTKLKPSNSVSFAEDSESGKPGAGLCGDEPTSGSKYGNSLTADLGSHSDGNNDVRNSAQKSRIHKTRLSPPDQTEKEGHRKLLNENTGGVTESDNINHTEHKSVKEQVKKSPSLSKAGRHKRKGLWKSSRRPKSLAEDCNDDHNSFSHRFSRRRASSPFKKDVSEGPGKPAPLIEMKTMRYRRDSEPYRNFNREVSIEQCPRLSYELEEDLLTIGSRNHYAGTFLETSIEEDYTMLDKDSRLMRSTSMTPEPSFGGTDVVVELTPEVSSIPIIKVTDNDVTPHSYSILNQKRVKPSSESRNEARIPLLRNSSTDNGKAVFYTQECNSTNTDSALTGSKFNQTTPQSERSCILSPSCQEGDSSSSSPTINSQSPHEPALITAYVQNLNPACSTINCNASSLQSCKAESKQWMIEESTGGSPTAEITPCRLTLDISRRSTMESRTSTMESSACRPHKGRKKRWQHFRCKNASIKASHSRHHKTRSKDNTNFSNNGRYSGRRSFVSYDADRLREETRAANARTALMLFTVTLVFVVAFLPAWLMAHRLVATQLMVFYLYFTYNVANPFIYAFMNVIFKDHLRKIFVCRRQRDLCLR